VSPAASSPSSPSSPPSPDAVDAAFVQSLARCQKWSALGGKSGSTFAKTLDNRYILKYVGKTEAQMFLNFAPSYFAYMAKVCFHRLPSLLVKIVGVCGLRESSIV
jgi:hypothetical protein